MIANQKGSTDQWGSFRGQQSRTLTGAFLVCQCPPMLSMATSYCCALFSCPRPPTASGLGFIQNNRNTGRRHLPPRCAAPPAKNKHRRHREEKRRSFAPSVSPSAVSFFGRRHSSSCLAVSKYNRVSILLSSTSLFHFLFHSFPLYILSILGALRSHIPPHYGVSYSILQCSRLLLRSGVLLPFILGSAIGQIGPVVFPRFAPSRAPQKTCDRGRGRAR